MFKFIRLSTFVLLGCVSSAIHASTTVTVTELIKDQPDSVVRQNARIKAQFAAIERLPVLLAGKESLQNDVLKTDIKAYLVAEVDVVTLAEKWDRNKGIYTLEASASLNETASLKLIDDVRDNLNAQKKLKEMYALFEQVAKQASISGSDHLELRKQIIQARSSVLIRDSIKASIEATKEYKAELYRVYEAEYLRPIIQDSILTFTAIDEESILYSVSLPSAGKYKDMYSYWDKDSVSSSAWKEMSAYVCVNENGRASNPIRLNYKNIPFTGSVKHRGSETFVSEPESIITLSVCYKKY